MNDYIDGFARAWAQANPAALQRVNTQRGPGASDGLDEILFVARIMRLHRFLDEALRAQLRTHAMSPAEFDILTILDCQGAEGFLRPGEITRRTLATTGGTATTLRHLEARGLVARERASDDGRSHRVRLTASGRESVRLAAIDAVSAQTALLTPREALTPANDALQQLLEHLGDVNGPSEG
ncbi:MarR family winged helix-turn-helix transcriptional regulator [Cryobacterium sp. TMT4-31]|uniref:MarR family winged helix-turn-helix transcriptional regulator n=1 Tax=Cryobacterium sp. TMT4-31 TaxID=1259259 RepID=UPI00141BE7CE|nr:MarR family transcriptional regulator [Cryobacterium sp. TMT4-31]